MKFHLLIIFGSLLALLHNDLIHAESIQKSDRNTGSDEANGNRVADRVVVAINNIPYTQLQIERYLDVKESLRDNAESSQAVNESNWTIALDAFIKDMMIHQEATKSSGFRPTKESIQKLRARSEKTASAAPQFNAAFVKLMLANTEIEAEILKIATVENYRRGKDSLNLNGKNQSSSWESELESRTIVRLFDGAKSWINISPRL